MLRSIRIGAFVVAAVTLGLASSAEAQVQKACKADGARLCPGIKPGSPEYVQCIKDNKEQLSPKCKAAAEEMKSNMKQQSPPEPGQDPVQVPPQ